MSNILKITVAGAFVAISTLTPVASAQVVMPYVGEGTGFGEPHRTANAGIVGHRFKCEPNCAPLPGWPPANKRNLKRDFERGTYITQVHWVDQRRNAKHPVEVVGDCFRNTACAAAVDALGMAVGIPPKTIRGVGLLTGVTTELARRFVGESTHIELRPRPGYEFCRVNIRANSVNLPNGPRASEMSIHAWPHDVGISTFTPRHAFGGPGSSWNGWFFLTQVRKGHNHGGFCPINAQRRLLYQCKGSRSHGGTCGKYELSARDRG